MPAHAPGSVRSVTEQNFAERVLQAERPVLIQFWAAWCRPCRLVTPIVESLAARHAVTAVPACLTAALRDAGVDR
ncbi:thioredoxin family protein [Nonomuraea sp. NPDC001699]